MTPSWRRLRGLMIVAGTIMALFWVLAVNGRVLYYFDTIGYINIGEKIVGSLIPANMLPQTALEPETFGGARVIPAAAVTGAESSDRYVNASRSLVYAVIVGALSLPGRLSWLVVVHAALLLLTVAQIARVTSRQAGLSGELLMTTCVPVIFCGLSALPFYVVYLMPDLMAALGILSAAILAVYARHMRTGEVLLAWCLAAFASTTHLSHLAILAVMVPIAALASWIVARTRWWVSPLLVGTASAAGILPVAALQVALALSQPAVVSDATMTPGSSAELPNVVTVSASETGSETDNTQILFTPFLTARLIVDGPGLTYLRKNCPDPDLATCQLAQFLIGPQARPDQFYVSRILFSKTPGEASYRLLPVDVQAQIAQEQLEFATLVLRTQPLGIVSALAKNTYDQLVLYSVDMTIPTYAMAWVINDDPAAIRNSLELGRLSQSLRWLDVADWVHGTIYLVSLAGLLWLLFVPKSGLPVDLRVFGGVVLCGVVANALICGGVSEPASRYGARVVWLVPYLLALLWMISYQCRKSARVNGI